MEKSIKNSPTRTQPVIWAALAAEPLFFVGNFPITNSLLSGWIVAAFLIVMALVVSKRTTLVPRGIHNFFEAIIDFLMLEIDKVTGDHKKTQSFLPVVGGLFIFILFNNWLGLLPGVGTVGVFQSVHGVQELVPLLRPATADLNMTLALATFSILTVQMAGIQGVGLINYISKFFNVRGIVRAIPKGPTAIGVAVIEFFVGLLEIIGEFARIASLSLRLFGNVFAGEILIGVMLSLLSYAVPVPFIFLELLVGVVQATVFSLLVLVFLTVATMEAEHAHTSEHGHT
jgi:F-type H+-transporting ATPase subunit a